MFTAICVYLSKKPWIGMAASAGSTFLGWFRHFLTDESITKIGSSLGIWIGVLIGILTVFIKVFEAYLKFKNQIK
ncbi:hypothetical protein EOD41_10735 [Mucilaginibacter limnophilus]|uniref:Uncharacterized protein n=1 Tax=Mucilaginibacter limnophilus TaxID=1932778 RepID=A0A437MTU9_9SPHI|nr:hypothetical protein [Mucilaginibacter limnophilus]RVU01082.1 hypothetical protein EOD41_10735 [Mucilaginibacter limnophilus]